MPWTMPLHAATNEMSAPAPHVRSVVRSDTRTGRLVRTVVATASVTTGNVTPPAQVHAMVAEAARKHEVSPALIESVMQVESNFRTYAVSPKGAEGLMQLMPATARRFGVANSFDARDNIEGGVRYLKFLQDTFKDDRLAIAAYNAGEGAVAKYKGVPPYKETVQYVERVGQKFSDAKRAAAAAPTPAPAIPEAARQPKLAQYIDAQGRVYITTE